ncbi:lipase secretion chaperone [Moritella yayanosii]|uniref:Lipase chaperone n=1 Tax=Moritella yayanosii TaxID=69539 RepID=A0A330LIV4_9GAMM|nr:lipase secretion chaperone [Moritella yayanosii]SQD77067.1 Lipase chaperone [Moritella yayanosii]
MKKIALTSIILIAVVTAIFIDTNNTDKQIQTQSLQSKSQLDTAIDSASARDTFEYFLSGLGEKELNALQAKFMQFNSQRPVDSQIDKALFQQYIHYKTYLQTLESDANSADFGLVDLMALNDQLLAAQLKFFTPEQQKLLFAEENQLRTMALKKLELQQVAASKEEFNAMWQQELQLLPEKEQLTYKNAALMGSLADTKGLDTQEKYLIRQDLVGAEGAQRLAELDAKNEVFNADVDNYLNERQALMTDDRLTMGELSSAITELRETNFPSQQQRRIKALERIHDANTDS